jgi:hypothetical protein
MEKMFAPQVLNPPWARNRAWRSRAPEARTVLARGPRRIAARGVPQGWEQVPAMGMGMGSMEITKTAAPINPTIGL